MLAAVMLAAALASPEPTASPSPTPQRMLGLIRAQYRSHRPPPPFETYTYVRAQKATNGYPDPVGSYTIHYWVRNADRAALTRQVFRDDYRGPLVFDRPAFNEDREPGPPTADVFEPAPVRPRPITQVPTPEPHYTPLPVIGGVRTTVELDYRVDALAYEGDLIHLTIFPLRDPDRNRLREIYADAKTLELRRLTTTDKLFVNNGKEGVFPITGTITMGMVQGFPVVTKLHAVVGGGYHDDGQEIFTEFNDIAFPTALPGWYFDPRTYAAHQNDAPS